MRFVKNIKKVIIAAALMCSAMALAACGGGSNSGTNGGEAEYKITVKDALGNTYGKDIIVELYKGDEIAGMQVCDENGVAAILVEKDTYVVKVRSADKEVLIAHEEGLEVSADKMEMEVIISNQLSDEAELLYVGGEEYDAYHVNAGCTNVELEKGKRAYFLFAPKESGTYEFSVVSDADTEIGYYGAPHFVQSASAAEVIDGKFTMSISESMIGTGDTGTTVMVIGVDALEDVNSAVLCINRIGEPQKTVADLPWTIYKTTAELSQYVLPAGKTLMEFDITSPAGYNLVLNKTDGYYHLNSADGPLVVMYLAEDPMVPYVPCFKTILERSGVSKYISDDEGEIIEKISYSECLLEYIEFADEATGVYPLTEDLKTIIQERGKYVGWWDSNNAGFIFKDPAGNPIPGLNAENAWLFMCAYISD